MKEKGFIDKVHKKLNPSIYKWKINDPYQGGVPDCFYSGPTGHCFVEYKYKDTLPKKNSTIIKFNLSSQQQLWLTKREAQSVPCFVALGHLDLVVFNNKFEKANHYTVKEFLEESIKVEDFIAKLNNLCLK